MKQEGRRGGLSLQAWLGRQEARHKAPFTLICAPLLPTPTSTSTSPPLQTTRQLSQMYRSEWGSPGGKVQREEERSHSLLYLAALFLFPAPPPFARAPSLQPPPSLTGTFNRRPMLKTLFRSVSVCLLPPSPSVPLAQPLQDLHFAYSICWLLPWAMIPFTSENSAPFV